MTVPAGKLTCDQGCKNTFRTTKAQEKHLKEKHVDAIQGTSKQTSSQDVRVTSQDDAADIQEEQDDKDLYDILEKFENKLSEDESANEMSDKIERLRTCFKKKSAVLKEMKEKYDHEVSLREEVEQRQKEKLDKNEKDMKMLRDRSISILKESKKKKKHIKELEKDRNQMNQELTDLRVANGILVQDNSVLKIDNENKSKYIKELQKIAEPSDEPEVVQVVTSTVLMNKTTKENKCHACDSSFATSRDLDRHISDKHSPKTCDFCDEVLDNERLFKKHLESCQEYSNTTVDCNKCHKKFTRFGIKRHGEKCHGPQATVYSCADCGKNGKSLNEIKKHQEAEHKEDEFERSREVCKHWRQGNCFKGNRCMFSHVGHQQKQTVNSNSTSSTWTPACKRGESCEWMAKGSCRYFHKGVGVQKPSSQGAQSHHRPSKSQESRSKECHFQDRCYNPSCPFKHSKTTNFSAQRGQGHNRVRVVNNNARFNQ